MNNWNLKNLYKSKNDKDIERDIKKSVSENKKFVDKWSNTNTYLKSPKELLKALKEYENLEEHYGQCTKPYYYFALLSYLDQTDTDIKARMNKIRDIVVKLNNNIQFFELNISKIPKEQQSKFLQSPLLKEYKHLLETFFASSQYLLTDKEEKVFNILNKTSSSNWADMLSELLDKQTLVVKDEKGKKKKISYNEISKYLDSKSKKTRDYASKQFNKINERYLEIAEFEINSILETKKSSDEYRGVSRPDLLRHLNDDIDSEIVDTLIKVVTDNFDISKRYYKYKAEKLGLRKLGYHERNVPLGNSNLEYSYEDSTKLVENTFKNLDISFYEIIKNFQKNGQYDVYPKQGKSGGAFCINISNSLPTYILLNHTNKLNDVLTIAHESGHGIHSEMSKSQSELNSGYPTSLAEVASTFFEDFVLDEILKNIPSKDKDIVLNQKINGDISTIFRQTAFYNFEKELHLEFRKQGYLKKEYICELFSKHMKAYLGDSVQEDDAMKYGWIYVSHFRRFFYVYSYASGQLISKALQSMVREDSKNIELVKKFLSSGSTKSPKDLFGEIGIDITKENFWIKGIKEIEREVNTTMS